MAEANPIANAYPTPLPPISKRAIAIAGILTTIYGLEELSHDDTEVACLWLLNPRLQTQVSMEPIAASIVNGWNRKFSKFVDSSKSLGLIAVTFDQRNHGSREIDKTANEAWRAGNENHAQDMLGIYQGTALDTSQLITYISSYVFPKSERTIVHHMVLGK